MKAHYKLKTLATLLILVLAASACAAKQAYKKGTQAEIARDYETALEQYRTALLEDPGNIEYRLKYEQARFTAAYEHFEKGRRALDAGDVNTARAEFARATEIDPTHDFGRQELADVDRVIASRNQRTPEPILDFEKLRDSTLTDPNLGSQMRTSLTDPITVSMTTESRTLYENLAALAGFTVIFDSRFRTARTTIEIQNKNIFEALDIVSLQTRNFWQPLNENTILVLEDTQQNRRDFEDHILKTIYLTNSITTNDLNSILNVLRTVLTLRGVFQSETQNAIVIHDTPGKVAMAERIIRALDKSKAEVVIDATVLEVDRNQLRDLGIVPPGESTLSFIPPGASADSTSNSVSLRDLSNVNSGNFSVSIPNSLAKFIANNATARLLQNPRIRTTDGVTASLRVGSEVPVPTTSFQSTNIGGGVNTAYTLQQVGVQLDIVSKVLLTREVSLNVTVTVRSLAGDRQVGELLIPVFTNRIVAHTIKLQEGETNILAGIISDTQTQNTTGIPGLKDIPFLKFLFGQEHKTRDQAEVIIMLTPHIVRMPDITEEDLKGVNVGGETNLRLRPDYSTPSTAPAPAPPAAAPVPPAAAPGQRGAAPPPAPPATPTTAVLSFAPAPVTVVSGDTSLNLLLNGSDILGAEMTLAFDPASFTIRDVRDGGFISQNGQVVAFVQNVDNQKGTARITIERNPGAPVVAGNGTLVTLMLQPGSKKGASALRVTDFGVRDGRQVLHPGKPLDVQVTVP